MRLFATMLLAVLLLSCSTGKHSVKTKENIPPKREFRGAWIQAVNGQFMGMNEAEMKGYLTTMLDNLQKVNVNAIIFQVRVEGDALYPSPHEPWSRYMMGQQGKNPGWDPLAFMVAEAHKRNMELHAWINPYRARTKGTKSVAANHQSRLRPGNFIEYEGQLYFNPSLQENRDHICKVITDIVTRYDVDGLHIDDYFYPYPVNGKPFNDDKWFRSSGYENKALWRRSNVNSLIEQIHKTVRAIKPWVKFGVSPFGIYRNEGSWEWGSRTKGLQSYDDLNADVLYWIDEGWVDYCIPQIYWEIGHKAADYEALVEWWAKYAAKRPLYIGQDVNRTVKAKDTENPARHQLVQKMDIQRSYPSVGGSCLWDAASAANNVGGYRDILAQNYQSYPALMPAVPFMDDDAPKKVKGVQVIEDNGEKILVWLPRECDDEMDAPAKYVVYRFVKGQKRSLSSAANIVAITRNTYYKIPADEKGRITYVVTVLDRVQNESKGVKCKVKL